MKKVLLMSALHALLEQEKTFLGRADMAVSVAATGEEALQVLRAERVDLIMAQLDLPGLTGEGLCARIRECPGAAAVPLILTCANTPEAIKRSSRCKADAVLLEPIHPMLLIAKAQQLLHIPVRDSIRVALNTKVDARTSEGSFYGLTRDVSASGMLIEIEKILAEGNLVACQFYLPVARQIKASGRILRIIQNSPGNTSYQYGLIFTEITPEARQLLIEYVEAESVKEREAGQ